MVGVSLLLFFITFVTSVLSHPTKKKEDCLIIVLVDGVRWDYIKEKDHDGFKKLAKHGVKAEYVEPIFPANSYPNWYTIVTGKYAESHSFVQNYMYDEKRREFFEMAPSPNASNVHWWNGSEPLWITAEKNGIKTGMYWWDGCQVPLRGYEVSYCRKYKSYKEFDVEKETEKAFSEVLDSCKKGERRLGLIYYEPVDAKGHEFGPDSKERKKALEEIDSILEKAQKEIEKKKLTSKVNLVVVSDHGMTNSKPTDITPINISRPDILEDIEFMLDKGSLSMIMPKQGREDQLYQKLTGLGIKGLHVYKKEQIPVHYHFKKNSLVLPILLLADRGYFIERIPGKKMYPDNNKIYNGFHGYDPYVKDNTDMRAIFYARGPGFKKGFQSSPIRMVDHYQIFCHILGIQPLPNNGSWNQVRKMMSSNSESVSSMNYLIQLIVAAVLVLVANFT